MENFSIWDPVEIPVGRCVSWKLGSLLLWTERYENEWHVLPVYSGDEADSGMDFSFRNKTEKPISTDWRHYLLREGLWAAPMPAMPDRPIVMRPDRALVLLPGERARFFISLPICFRLLIGKSAVAKNKRKLYEFPIVPMANAWFGDPVSGELCYFTAVRLYPEFDQTPLSPVRAVCPLMISNESDKDLSFDRICLHTEFLGIYRGPSRFWTNEVNVIFKGSDQATQIMPSKTAPSFNGQTKLVCEARQVIENWYFKKTFSILKQFTGF